MLSILNGLFSSKRASPTNATLLNFVRLEHGKLDSIGHKVDNLEKRFLVWTGKFKSIDEVPTFVSHATMDRAKNRMRIKIANYMMLATAIGCMAMIYSGKQAAKKGESVQKQNLEWHKEAKQAETK